MYDLLLQAGQWLVDTGISDFLQEDANTFPALEVIHVLAIALVVGPILLLDLRLMDRGFGFPLHGPRLMRLIVPIAITAFVVAILSGALMFASQPLAYLQTPVFLVKMGLLGLAGANMVLFHRWFSHAGVDWREGAPSPARARIAGLMSMVLWLSVLTTGRFIGFVLAI